MTFRSLGRLLELDLSRLRSVGPDGARVLGMPRGVPLRDRDLTVKGSRHLTFNITVKLTIKEEMLNLTCRQIFIHSSKA